MGLVNRLLGKSEEAFVLAIEVYNKPTLHYRLEGFSFLICNAWELMLKAHMINKFGESSIYYSDKPGRTLSLENCIEKVFTNQNAPLRRNLVKIIELRNTSTHFITEEYEMVYVPLLQACVFNFVEKMNEFHGIDMTRTISENFINLTVRVTSLDEAEIRAKYTKQVAEKLVATRHTLSSMIDENNSSFAIRVEHHYYQTKNKNDATELYHIDKDTDEAVRIVKELKNPNETHKYSAKNCVKEINKRLSRNEIGLSQNGQEVVFNTYHFGLFTSYYGLKDNERYCFVNKIYAQPQYSYSIQAIDFIVEEIRKNPDGIIDDLKGKRNANPGSKGF